MGEFFEDGRIRSKNREHNEAYKLYENLKAFGYSNQEIINYAQLSLSTDNLSRYEIFKRLILLVGGINESETNLNSVNASDNRII
jgi:hypothetical protein